MPATSGYRIVEVDAGGGMVRHKSTEQLQLERKRQTNISAKEEARKQKEAGRTGRGSVGGGGKTGESRPRVDKAELEARRKKELAEKKDRRQAQIKEAEADRLRKQSSADGKKHAHQSKYSKKEIMILHELFSEYDTDGGGEISVQEFKGHFNQINAEHNRYDGRAKDFAERRAARAGLDLMQLVEPMFNSLDVDNDGTVGFFELLKVLYPMANEQDIATFKEWVHPPEPELKPIKYVLSVEQKAELKDMFRIIDADRNGELSVQELKAMFLGSAITGETGIDMMDLEKYFRESDFDNSNTISIAEFERLMVSTGLYVPEQAEVAK